MTLVMVSARSGHLTSPALHCKMTALAYKMAVCVLAPLLLLATSGASEAWEEAGSRLRCGVPPTCSSSFALSLSIPPAAAAAGPQLKVAACSAMAFSAQQWDLTGEHRVAQEVCGGDRSAGQRRTALVTDWHGSLLCSWSLILCCCSAAVALRMSCSPNDIRRGLSPSDLSRSISLVVSHESASELTDCGSLICFITSLLYSVMVSLP